MNACHKIHADIVRAGLRDTIFSPEFVLERHRPSNPERALVMGISCYYHDSAVCLMENGRIRFSVEEERFSRRKHDRAFPRNALAACAEYVGVGPREIDLIVFYEDPILKLRRILSHNGKRAAHLCAKLVQQVNAGLSLQQELAAWGYCGPVEYALHHAAHAASAFYVSPFDEACVLTVDAVGEYATCELWRGEKNGLERIRTIFNYPNSLGMLYSGITNYLGFKVNNDEYKVMGLASYGRPVFMPAIEALAGPPDAKTFHLDMDAFVFDRSDDGTVDPDRLERLLGFPPRTPESELRQEHKDLAASVQTYMEHMLCSLTTSARRETGLPSLCLSGGVALNCVANARIMQESGFEHFFIQPAAGDAGGAVGAALLGSHVCLAIDRKPSTTHNTCLGPEFGEPDVVRLLEEEFVPFQRMEDDQLFSWVAECLAQGKVVGWFQERMEFGPRALGNRSILADPRRADMQAILNAKVKHRESFRPFAPAVLWHRAQAYFDLRSPSPYMLMTATVLRPDEIPAVTHIDGSARVQTVHETITPRFFKLISAFDSLTGTPVLVNTSFNIRGEPIVCTPRNAFDCFTNTDIDVLVLGNVVVLKEELV